MVLPCHARAVPWVPTVLYGAVLGGGVYLDAVGGAGTPPARLAGFVVGLLLLAVLDVVERRRYGGPTPPRPAVAFFVARLLLFAAVAALDTSSLSRALFVLVPFEAYVAFGAGAGVGAAVACTGVVVAGFTLRRPGWYLEAGSISALLMLVIGMVLAISMAAVVGREQRARAGLERALREIEESHARLTEYAARVSELSAATERNRLARDIHDSLGHHLTAVAIQLEKASTFLDHDPAAARQALVDARGCARRALEDVRRSVQALRDQAQPVRLSTALAELVRDLDDDRHRVDLDIAGEESGYPAATLTALFRAAQEALTNARRHGAATRVSVVLRFDGRGAHLEVTDNGRGFRPADGDRADGDPSGNAPAGDRGAGLGLLGMRERVQLVGGHVMIVSRPGAGTRLTVTVPKAPPA